MDAAADVLLVREHGTTPVPLRWRGFDVEADLDLDFRSGARTTLVTELLARCRGDAAGDLETRRTEALQLTLAARIGGLAAIVARTAGTSDIVLDLRCPIQNCREALHVSLSLGWVLELSRQVERERWIRVAVADAQTLRVRVPTGDDQHAWRSRAYESPAAADRAMVATLLDASGTLLSGSTLAAIDAALEDADPLSCFRVTTPCPACGEQADHEIDLEDVLLARLQRAQQTVLHDIHRLAARYGWSEREIVALPEWRRRAYLDFIDREES